MVFGASRQLWVESSKADSRVIDYNANLCYYSFVIFVVLSLCHFPNPLIIPAILHYSRLLGSISHLFPLLKQL